MSLLKEWRDHAYGLDERTPEGNKFWLDYFQREKAIYEQLLEDPSKEVKGTVKELAEKYDMPLELMVGFLDGIDDSLIKSNDVDNITEDSEVSLLFDTEKVTHHTYCCVVVLCKPFGRG